MMLRALIALASLMLLAVGSAAAQGAPTAKHELGGKMRSLYYTDIVTDANWATVDEWVVPPTAANWVVITWTGAEESADKWIEIIIAGPDCLNNAGDRDTTRIHSVARSFTFGGCGRGGDIDSIGINTNDGSPGSPTYYFDILWSD